MFDSAQRLGLPAKAMSDAVDHLKLRDFRTLADAELRFDPGWNFFVGNNAQGKTSILEAVAVLLRLQSPRTRRLTDLIRLNARGLLLDGYVGERHLQFYYSPLRKKLALDSVEQKQGAAYLEIGRVVVFTNEDIQLARGSAEGRRRFLDFLGAQMWPAYRTQLRAYDWALRSRNRLLKQPGNPWRQIVAYNGPLIDAGNALREAREKCIAQLRPLFQKAVREIAQGEIMDVLYSPGVEGDFEKALALRREEEQRAGLTLVGPHRDDLALTLSSQPAMTFASEGQQRTLVLALKIAEAKLLAQTWQKPPALLIDDIFGELDATRRRAVLSALPQGGQHFVTSTSFSWIPEFPGVCWQVEQGRLSPIP